MALNEASWALFWALFFVLPLGAVLGPCLNILGPFRGLLEPPSLLGLLGPFLGPPEACLEPFLNILGPLAGLLRPSWGRLEASGALWKPIGATRALSKPPRKTRDGATFVCTKLRWVQVSKIFGDLNPCLFRWTSSELVKMIFVYFVVLKSPRCQMFQVLPMGLVRLRHCGGGFFLFLFLAPSLLSFLLSSRSLSLALGCLGQRAVWNPAQTERAGDASWRDASPAPRIRHRRRDASPLGRL